MIDISHMRQSYERNKILKVNEFDNSPFNMFALWFNQAKEQKEVTEANAFILSTVNKQNRIRSRTVLLKYFDEKGFMFFTNYNSQKAQDIEDNKQVAMLFPWYSMERQLMIEGSIEKVGSEESSQYFSKRPRSSQIGAWVSAQSSVIPSRDHLKATFDELSNKFEDKDIPLPDFWGGYRIKPSRFEFWQGQRSRLHDRIQYTKQDSGWQISRLSP